MVLTETKAYFRTLVYTFSNFAVQKHVFLDNLIKDGFIQPSGENIVVSSGEFQKARVRKDSVVILNVFTLHTDECHHALQST